MFCTVFAVLSYRIVQHTKPGQPLAVEILEFLELSIHLLHGVPSVELMI